MVADMVPPERKIYINPNFNKPPAASNQSLPANNTTATTTFNHNQQPLVRTTVAINPRLFRQHGYAGFAGGADSGAAPVPKTVASAIHMNPEFLRRLEYQTFQMQQQQHAIMQLQQLQQHQQPVCLEQTQYQQQQQPAYASQPAATATVDHHTVFPTETQVPGLHTTTPLAKDTRKILSKSRTCIIREPANKPKSPARPLPPPPPPPKPLAPAQSLQPIVKLTRRKLVRKRLGDTNAAATAVAPLPRLNSPLWRRTYKLDRTIKSPTTLAKSKISRFPVLMTRYAMRRAGLPSNTAFTASSTVNKKLLNINGMLYKVTPNRLERRVEVPWLRRMASRPLEASKTTTKPRTPVPLSTKVFAPTTTTTTRTRLKRGHHLIVNGSHYVMDPSGFKITRMPATTATDSRGPATQSFKEASNSRKRIDIGGLTYVASSTKENVFVRTQNHMSRAYLNQAKHRSLKFLARRYTKTNEPCPMYQRRGKCTGRERGSCTKLHDPNQVAICPAFLRGTCNDPAGCLLSHDVSLAKMPVCRFYLEAKCGRLDCPYLHKKLGSRAVLCEDFLRGYCKLAAECDKRHEFVCPHVERKGVCPTRNCMHCKNAKRWSGKQAIQSTVKEKPKALPAPPPPPLAIEPKGVVDDENCSKQGRYFQTGKNEKVSLMAPDEAEGDEAGSEPQAEEDDDVALEPPLLRRPKAGDTPSFIPI